MHPLPPAPYEPATWRSAKVQNDYTITDGLNRYSVPSDLIGECVDVRLTRDTVEIYFHGGRVTSHVRLKKAQRDAVMVPEAHRKYLAYNKAAFLSWAETAGASVSKVVSQFLGSGKESEQGYKYCVSIMKAADWYSQDRVNAACERALAFFQCPGAQERPYPSLKTGRIRSHFIRPPISSIWNRSKQYLQRSLHTAASHTERMLFEKEVPTHDHPVNH